MLQFVTPPLEGHDRNEITYKGIVVNQHINVLEFLDWFRDSLAKDYNIIEIGSAYFGFTAMLADHDISRNGLIHTFDHHDILKNPFPQEKVKVHTACCFKDQQKIVDLIQNSDKPIILFCDGGNKPAEFNLYAGLIRPGDFILAHDYFKNPPASRDKLFYEFKAEWPALECQYSEIRAAVREHGLENMDPEKNTAAKAFWALFRKP